MSQLQDLARGLRLLAEIRRALATERDRVKTDQVAELLVAFGSGHKTKGEPR